MAKTTVVKVPTPPVSQGLGSVGSLFSDSWDLFKKSWTQQLVLGILVTVLSGLVFLLGVILFAVINIPQIPSVIAVIQHSGQGWNALSPMIWMSAATIAVVMTLLFYFIVVAYAVGMLVLVQGIYKGQPVTFTTALRMGLSKSIPMLFLGILTTFCIFGGFWLFVIPGLVIGIFLSYAKFEVALNSLSPISTMRKSVQVVGANFWGILGRIVLLAVLLEVIMGVSSVFGVSLQHYGLTGIWGMVNLVLQYAIQFFAVAFSLVLYNRSRDASVNAKPASLTFMVVVAILGWVFAMVVGGALFTASKTAWPMIQDAIKQEQMKQSTDMQQDGTQDPSIMPDQTDQQGNVFYDYTNDNTGTVVSTPQPIQPKVVPNASPSLYR